MLSPYCRCLEQRSSTGTTGKSISKTRTSDNAFVTHTKTAQALKRRIFQLLGIEEYRESWADGLQVSGKFSDISALEAENSRVHALRNATPVHRFFVWGGRHGFVARDS